MDLVQKCSDLLNRKFNYNFLPVSKAYRRINLQQIYKLKKKQFHICEFEITNFKNNKIYIFLKL